MNPRTLSTAKAVVISLLFLLPALGVTAGALWPVWTESPAAPHAKRREFRQSAGASDLHFGDEQVPLQRASVRQRLEHEISHLTQRNMLPDIYRRAALLAPTVRPLLVSHDLPEDFFFLILTESGGRVRSVSPKGAAGLWQLMPRTARSLGLRVDNEVDERLNLEKSTEAAAGYLKAARERFGSWFPACNAYNCGPGRLSKLMRKAGTRDVFALSLPAETQGHLFRTLAIKQLVEQRMELPETQLQTAATRRLEVRRSVPDLAQLARQQGATLAELRELNPWLLRNRLTVRPGDSYELQLPLRD